MPLFVYMCPTCEFQEEYLLKLSDGPPECPLCKDDMEKQVPMSHFSLKGNGWAKDLYSKPNNNGSK